MEQVATPQFELEYLLMDKTSNAPMVPLNTENVKGKLTGGHAVADYDSGE